MDTWTFLRFLLGLSLELNQSVFEGLLKHKGGSSETSQETVKYIKIKTSRSGRISRAMHQLVFILLSSEKELDVFALRKYSASEEGLLRLMPVVKASNKSF